MVTKPLTIAMPCLHSSPIGNIGSPDTGGMSIFVRELAQALGCRGHFIDIYTRSLAGSSPQVIDFAPNVRIIHLPVDKARALARLELYALLPECLSLLESFLAENRIRYDLVYSHYWLSGCLGEMVRELWQVPHLITFHTLGAVKNSFNIGSIEPELRITTEKRLAEKSHGIILSSERERNNLVDYYGIPVSCLRSY